MSDDTAVTRRFCPSCGTRCHLDWHYCAACGGELPEVVMRDSRAPSHAAPGPSVRERFAALVEQRQRAGDVTTDSEDARAEPAGRIGPARPPVAPEPLADRKPMHAAPEVEVAAHAGAEPAEESSLERQVGEPEGWTAPIVGEPLADSDRERVEHSAGRSGRQRAFGRSRPAPMMVDAEIAEPRRQGTVTGYVQLVTLVAASLAVAVVGGLVSLNGRLTDFTRTGDADRVQDAEALVENVFQPMFFAASAFVLLGLSWWTLRRRREFHALTLEESRFSDLTAVVSWLIPVVNLVIPVLVLDELWRAGRARSNGRRIAEEAPNPWLWAWSGLVGLGVLIAAFAASLSPESIERTIDANTWSAIGYAVIGLGLLALVLTTSAVATTVRFPLRARPEEPERTVELLSVD